MRVITQKSYKVGLNLYSFTGYLLKKNQTYYFFLSKIDWNTLGRSLDLFGFFHSLIKDVNEHKFVSYILIF